MAAVTCVSPSRSSAVENAAHIGLIDQNVQRTKTDYQITTGLVLSTTVAGETRDRRGETTVDATTMSFGKVWENLAEHFLTGYITVDMTRTTAILLSSVFSVGLASPVFARQTLSRTAMEKAAKKACALGDYQKGEDILTDLFVETDDPMYIFNQGRCYQQNNRWEQAISRFREYLRKAKNASESDRADAERQIADCEASLAKATQAASPPVAPMSAGPVARVEPPPAALESTENAVASSMAPPPSDGDNGKGLRMAGIISAAVGVAALGTGVGLALKSQSLPTKDYSRSREDERASLKTWGLVSYGVGAAAIATGVVLYVFGWPHQQSSSVALLPVAAPNGASMLLKGTF